MLRHVDFWLTLAVCGGALWLTNWLLELAGFPW